MDVKNKKGFPTPKRSYYKVYVITNTYNQSNYIEDCLNGVLMQETDFPFIHHVIDDCSSDGEQEVIKRWIENNCDLRTSEYYDNETCTIILASAQKNPNYTILAYFLKKNLWKYPQEKDKLYTVWREECAYEALCEGDDYWIHPMKLQQQVGFLDSQIDYGLVYTGFKIRYRDNFISQSRGGCPEGNVYDRLLLNPSNFVCTVTTCYRISLFKQVKPYYSQPYFKMGDLPLWLALSYVTKFKYIKEITSVYRKTDLSASHFKEYKKTLEFDRNVQEIKLYFAKMYNNTKAKDVLVRRIFQYDSLIALKEKRYLDSLTGLVKGHGIMKSLLIDFLKHIGK